MDTVAADISIGTEKQKNLPARTGSKLRLRTLAINFQAETVHASFDVVTSDGTVIGRDSLQLFDAPAQEDDKGKVIAPKKTGWTDWVSSGKSGKTERERIELALRTAGRI